ncbi:MAG TPA: TOMM precursor leader peptide-binding protein, partial [Cryptosporangiaceae bacterium]|nr:TOMM precursor leader peptide-binding protein [Cryptosporangiaceae bacterium]
TRAPAPGRRPDFVVLAAGPVPSPGDRLRWTAQRVPHLPVLLRDATAVVGPLVIPGSTACLDCVELHRRDRDQVWPAVAAQLATDPAPEASHVAVATAAAALAALQVLAHLDGEDPETRGLSLELNRLGDRVRHRPWTPHPRCGCLDALPTRAA